MSRKIMNVYAASLVGLLSVPMLSHAVPIAWNYDIADNYFGCQGAGHPITSCGSYSNQDVIGDANLFDVTNVKVVRTVGGDLTIDVFNTLAGDSGTKFSDYTDNPEETGTQRTGIGYGDLFISDFSATKPYNGVAGSAGNYAGDNHENGHRWTHAIAFETFTDRYTDGSGNIVLYEFDQTDIGDSTVDFNFNNAFLSDDFMTGATYRNGQEVAVRTDSTTVSKVVKAGTTIIGTWKVTDLAGDPLTSTAVALGKLTFNLNVNGTALENWTGLALKWSFTCANDTIEGFDNNQVAEPAVLALLGIGLLGMCAARRRLA